VSPRSHSYVALGDGLDYNDLGDAYLDRITKSTSKKALVNRLERLGYRVTLEPIERAPDPGAAAAA
jgi:hypothetical protein